MTAQLQHTTGLYANSIRGSWELICTFVREDIGYLCGQPGEYTTGWKKPRPKIEGGKKGQDFIRPWHMTMCFLPTSLTRQFHPFSVMLDYLLVVKKNEILFACIWNCSGCCADYRQWVQRGHNGSAISPEGGEQQQNSDKISVTPPPPLSERMRKRRGTNNSIQNLRVSICRRKF